MTGPTLSRRRFVVAGLGAAAVAASGAALVASRRDDPPEPQPPPGTHTASADPGGQGTVEAVGRRYLEKVPEEADRAVLRAALPAGAEGAGGRSAVSAAVAADFSAGRTVELDGWLLSVTECRLAALSVV